MGSRRWDSDERGRGIADARAILPAIQQLAELAGMEEWVTEDPETHLLPGLRERVEISGLSLESVEVEPGGVLWVLLASPAKQSRREIRESVWSILGGVTELTTLVLETVAGESVNFEIVTGMPPGEGQFSTHGHTLRIEVQQPG
jgi:hypothetical protein